MSDDILDDPDFTPPGKPDFRRVGKGVPMVKDPETGKYVRRRRSSSAGKVLDDESNLTDWKLRTVLVGAAQLPEVLAMVSVLDPEQDKKAIRDHVEECLQAGKGNARKVKGTAIHAMFDHVDLGHDWQPAPQFKAAVDAYVQMLEVYGLVPVDVEAQCVNDKYGLAGTLDRRYRTIRPLVAPDGVIIPIGSIIVGDTKTGLRLEYAAGTYVTQLAAYVDSCRYDVATDERSDFDPPNYPDWALVIHASSEAGTCELYWADIEQGRQGLALAHQVWQWRRSPGKLTPAMPPLRMVPELPTEPSEPSEPSGEPCSCQSMATGCLVHPDGSGVAADPAVKEWLRGRVLVLLEHEKARGDLQRHWPVGVPGLKAEGHTPGQLLALEAVIDQVEATWSIPFGPTDPRVLASRDAHPSTYSSKWAKPVGEPINEDEKGALAEAIMEHPRNALLRQWAEAALLGSIGKPPQDTYPLAHALYEFAKLPVEDWSDDDVTTMLIGTLNAMGYPGGLNDLGSVKPEEAPTIMGAAFAITTGTAMLMFDADNKPVVRFNVQQQKGYPK